MFKGIKKSATKGCCPLHEIFHIHVVKMNLNLVILFVIIFTLGGGGFLFWKRFKNVNSMDDDGLPRDAELSNWVVAEGCKAHSGSCGKGQAVMERKCLREGKNSGKLCSQIGPTRKTVDCWVHCEKPTDVVDWGHPNDAAGLPEGSPRKGWYDFTGQGQPNDYCRWVGPNESKFWACHTRHSPYDKADVNHITFSAGPANDMKPFSIQGVRQMCPMNGAYAEATDPDLQKSIANGFMSHCGARCVYDHRNPKTGWTYDGKRWVRIDNMTMHECGISHKNEMKKAIQQYDKKYDVKHSWTIL
jgi:hypothetical protein